MAAEVHGQHQNTGAYEGHAGSEEPSANHRHYACDAEDGALTAPGAVSQ